MGLDEVENLLERIRCRLDVKDEIGRCNTILATTLIYQRVNMGWAYHRYYSNLFQTTLYN